MGLNKRAIASLWAGFSLPGPSRLPYAAIRTQGLPDWRLKTRQTNLIIWPFRPCCYFADNEARIGGKSDDTTDK